jgi:hypothetical protein
MKIKIKDEVFQQMFEYAFYAKKHFSSEIAGWGHYNNDRGIYKLAPLCEQTVEGSEVNNFPNDIMNDINYDMSDMLVQWHSHVDMPCAPSGEYGDLGNIKQMLKIMPSIITIIVNCKGEYSARLDTVKIEGCGGIELTEPVTINLELIRYYDNDKISKEVLAKCRRPEKKIIEERVTAYTPTRFSTPNYEGYYNRVSKDYTPPRKDFSSYIKGDFKIAEILKEIANEMEYLVEKYESSHTISIVSVYTGDTILYNTRKNELKFNSIIYTSINDAVRIFYTKSNLPEPSKNIIELLKQ